MGCPEVPTRLRTPATESGWKYRDQQWIRLRFMIVVLVVHFLKDSLFRTNCKKKKKNKETATVSNYY